VVRNGRNGVEVVWMGIGYIIQWVWGIMELEGDEGWIGEKECA
jgi:hypothetical protein